MSHRPAPANIAAARPSRHVLGMRVDAVSMDEATRHVIEAARRREPSYVCVANVHMVMEAWDDPTFQGLVNDASMVVADGMPLVWALRALGVTSATRVRGPDLVWSVTAAAARAGVPVALYGGAPDVLTTFGRRLQEHAPQLDIREMISPPFGARSLDEQAEDVVRLRGSGARIVLVGLGCPKQERWMAQHHAAMPAVLIGVGAAFDFHAGRMREAPAWMQRVGAEWLFRLAQEPRRLWRRYARHNPRFVAFFALQLLGLSPRRRRGPA